MKYIVFFVILLSVNNSFSSVDQYRVINDVVVHRIDCEHGRRGWISIHANASLDSSQQSLIILPKRTHDRLYVYGYRSIYLAKESCRKLKVQIDEMLALSPTSFLGRKQLAYFRNDESFETPYPYFKGLVFKEQALSGWLLNDYLDTKLNFIK